MVKNHRCYFHQMAFCPRLRLVRAILGAIVKPVSLACRCNATRRAVRKPVGILVLDWRSHRKAKRCKGLMVSASLMRKRRLHYRVVRPCRHGYNPSKLTQSAEQCDAWSLLCSPVAGIGYASASASCSFCDGVIELPSSPDESHPQKLAVSG